jgi:hypothetical protein
MSRKLLVFLLNQLNIVRVKCLSCKKVIEMPPEELAMQFSTGNCPLCNRPLTMLRGSDNPFLKLAKAIEDFKQHASTVEIELIIDDKSE